MFGTETKVTVRRHETCEDCRGSAPLRAKRRSPAAPAPGAARCAISKDSSAWPAPVPRARALAASSPILAPSAKGRAAFCASACRGQNSRRRGRRHAHPLHRPGRSGAFGGPAGDLYVILHVKEHPFFEREGNDLHCVIPVSFTQAALGH